MPRQGTYKRSTNDNGQTLRRCTTTAAAAAAAATITNGNSNGQILVVGGMASVVDGLTTIATVLF